MYKKQSLANGARIILKVGQLEDAASLMKIQEFLPECWVTFSQCSMNNNKRFQRNLRQIEAEEHKKLKRHINYMGET